MKTGIVSGGAQGIGRAIAERLISKKYRIYLLDSDSEAGKETESELGKDAVFIPCDVGNFSAVEGAFRRILTETDSLDALVNCAGIFRNVPLSECTPELWNRILSVNLSGAFYLCKAFESLLRKAHGAVVNIASTRALQSEPNTEAYAASKGGLVALTHSLAVSLGPNVRVNCICPGWIEVGDRKKKSERVIPRHSAADHLQHPAGRVGTPEDIAAMADFLLSEESGFVTGANFVVDGGMTRKMIYTE